MTSFFAWDWTLTTSVANSTTSTFDSTTNQTVNIKYDSNNAGASAMTSEVIKVIKL